MIGLFGRIQSLLQGSFAKETYTFKEPTSGSHPIVEIRHPIYFGHRNVNLPVQRSFTMTDSTDHATPRVRGRLTLRWRRCIESFISVGHFLQKSPIISSPTPRLRGRLTLRWRRSIGSFISVGHFPQKSPIISSSTPRLRGRLTLRQRRCIAYLILFVQGHFPQKSGKRPATYGILRIFATLYSPCLHEVFFVFFVNYRLCLFLV